MTRSEKEWINEILCLFFDQRLPNWKVFSPWVQLIAWCWPSSERVRGQEGTIKQSTCRPAPALNTILWPNALRMPELSSLPACRRKQQTTKPPADFYVKRQQKKKKAQCPVFFLVLCSCFITQTKSFINALSWNLKGIIPVMNCIPCGFNCADAAWSADLVKNHCVDGKLYLEKQKKVCKWKTWWHIFIPQYWPHSNMSWFSYTPCMCTHMQNLIYICKTNLYILKLRGSCLQLHIWYIQ